MDFNVQPYYDDFDKTKNFHKVLFRPGYPVQARELNQIQSILQNQVARFGEHFFKDGDKVYGGDLSIDKVQYVKLKTDVDKLLDPSMVGQTLVGNKTGVIGTIIALTNMRKYTNEKGISITVPPTVFVRFNNTNVSNSRFSQSETLVFQNGVRTACSTETEDAIGDALIAQIESGIFFILGYFVYVEKQSLVLSEYNSVDGSFDLFPSCRVGLTCNEYVVTPEEDESLLDNANGSNNYAAPGAHRYGIISDLTKVPISEDINKNNFYELSRVINGSIYKKNETNAAGLINEAYLARRTYDESGDYVVEPFTADVREHRNNFRGEFVSGRFYYTGDIVEVNHDVLGKSFYIASSNGFSGTLDQGAWGDTSSKTWTDVVVDHNNLTWIRNENPSFNNGYYDAIGKIVDIKVKNRGSGYTTFPKITITDKSADDGVSIVNPNIEKYGAKAIAVIDTSTTIRNEQGKLITSVEDVVITDKGSEYIGTPIVEIEAPSEGVKAELEAVCDCGQFDKLLLNISRGKAYVRGYEIEKNDITRLEIPKAISTYTVSNMAVSSPRGQYAVISNLKYVPNVNTMEQVYVTDAAGVTIGTCNVTGLVKFGNNYKLYFINYSGSPLEGNCNKFQAVDSSGKLKTIGYTVNDHNDKVVGNISELTSTQLSGTGSGVVVYTGTITVKDALNRVEVNDVLNIEALVGEGNVINALVSVDAVNINGSTTTITYRTLANIVNATEIANIKTAIAYKNTVLYTTNVIPGSIKSNTAIDGSNRVTITSEYSNYSEINATSPAPSLVIISSGITPDYYRAKVVPNAAENKQNQLVLQFDSPDNGRLSVTADMFKGGVVAMIKPTTSSIGDPECIFPLSVPSIKSIENVRWSSMYYTQGSPESGIIVTLPIDNSVKWIRNDDRDVFLLQRADGNISKLDIADPKYKVEVSANNIRITGVVQDCTVYACVCVEPSTPSARVEKSQAITTIVFKDSIVDRKINLGLVDCYELVSVLDGDGNDLTEYFELVPNVTPYAYKESYIVVKRTHNTPKYTSQSLFIKVRYYSRSTVDSAYKFYDALSYKSFVPEDVPLYRGNLLTTYLDLRPDVLSSATTRYNLPIVGQAITMNNVEVYMARKDRIVLDTSGNFHDIQGRPSEDPYLPDVPNDTMNIFNITVYPETSTEYRINPIKLEAIDNRRYTMRDIGHLSKKIDTLQEYTTLTMLELQTSTLNVGNRIKQGFVVDGFDNTTSNVRDEGKCHCSYDTENGILRPPFIVNNMQLSEYIVEGHDRSDYNYKSWNTKITLPIVSNTIYMSFTDASKAITVNPYNNVNYIGSITMNPATDDAFDQMTNILSVLANEYDDLSDRINKNMASIITNANNIAINAGNISTNANAIEELRKRFANWNTYWTGRDAELRAIDNALTADVEELKKRKYEIINNNTYITNVTNVTNRNYYYDYDNSH